MNTQLSLFEQEFTTPIHTTVQSSSKVVMFPGLKTPPHKPNYRKGEEQTVFPIKRQEDLDAMASWLYNNADHKYLLGFILGINLGLRANELLELKHSDIFFPNGEIRYVSDDFSDTTDKMSVYQNKVHKRRGMYLNESCVKALNWYFPMKNPSLYSDQYLFPSREGGHIEVDTLRKVLKDAAKACGLKQNIGTHTLRKTFGYFHYQFFHDIVFLQRLFGHSSALITMGFHIALPPVVEAAIAKYREENDWLAHFVTDNCEVGPGMTAKSGEVYQAYRTYCADTGEFFRSTAEFYAALDTAGYTRSRTNKGVIVHGLKLKNRDCAAFDDFLN